MKTRWTLEIGSTEQVLGGFLENTAPMTETQMISYVRKVCRQMLANNRELKAYSIWAEDEADENHVFHIEARRNDSYIDIKVWDTQRKVFVVDTVQDRINRRLREIDECIIKGDEYIRALASLG